MRYGFKQYVCANKELESHFILGCKGILYSLFKNVSMRKEDI